MSKAIYPDWVMKYKSKGVYVNKKGDTYYLYKAHSERIKGTNKVRRISDGYLGRVTEKDGFIPVKDKVQGHVFVYDFGLFSFLSQLSINIYSSFKRTHKTFADSILSLGILRFLELDPSFYYSTGLFNLYPSTNTTHFSDPEVILQSHRVKSMITHFIETRIKSEDWLFFTIHLPSIHLAKINDLLYLSSINEEVTMLLQTYNMEVTINVQGI